MVIDTVKFVEFKLRSHNILKFNAQRRENWYVDLATFSFFPSHIYDCYYESRYM